MPGGIVAHQNAPGILQVEMRYESDGQSIYNVFHVKQADTDAWELSEITDVMDVFYDTYWSGAQQALLTEEVRLAEIVATDLTSLDGLRVTNPIVPDEIGTHLGTVMPNNVTLAIKFAVATRGRGTSGRIFWPPPPEDVVVADQFDADYVTSIIGALQALQDALVALDPSSKLVVLSKVASGIYRANGIGKDIIAFGASDFYVDTQKLRLPRHKKSKRAP